ncbi:MAG: hypothetical protein HC837_14490 [Chloroflexaceae bacterium]|nr:hypothetical protein [Chloroflexaceae bacterium]
MEQTNIPFWRDIRVLMLMLQIAFVIVIVVLAGILYANVVNGMAEAGLRGDFEFMQGEAGFEIGFALIPFEPTDTRWHAFSSACSIP